MQIPVKVQNIYAQTSRWAFPLLAVLLIFSMWNGCQKEKIVGSLAGVVDSLSKKTVQLETENGRLVATNEQLDVSASSQLEALTDTIFDLRAKDRKNIKAIENYTRIIQQGQFSDKFAPFIDSAGDVPDSIVADIPQNVTPQASDTNYVKLPQSFMYMDDQITFSGRLSRRGVWLDKITIDDTLHLRTVINKTGFLNLGRTTMVQAVHSNKGINSLGVSSLVVPQKTNWWNRWGKPVVASLLTGLGAYKLAK